MEETAKDRVRRELSELVEKMCALQRFLFSEQSIKLSREMKCTMREQLNSMANYASTLVHRLEIWDVVDIQPTKTMATDW